MIRKSLAFLLFFLMFQINVYSQTTGHPEKFVEKYIPLNLSYFGEMFTHPGLMVGTEWELAGNNRHHLLWTGNVGGYIHVRNHIGLFVNTEIGWRMSRPSGYFMDAFAGVGYLRVWPHGTVYEVTNNTVSEVDTAGSSKFMPSFSWGFFGWDFIDGKETDFSIYSRLQVFGEYPFNSYMLPHIAIQMGIRFYLGGNKN